MLGHDESSLINMTEHRSTSEDELNQSAKRMTFFDEPTSDKNHKEPRNTEHRSTSEDELNQSAKRMTFFDEPTSDKNHKEPRNTEQGSTSEDELNQSAKRMTFFDEPTSDKNHKEPRNTEHRSTSEDELNQSAKRMTFFDEPTSDKNHKEPRNTEHRSTSEDELNQSAKRMTFFDEPTSDKNHKEPRNTEQGSTSEDELNQSAKRMTFFDEPTSDKNHKEPRNTEHRSTSEDELNQSAKRMTFFDEPTSDKNHKEPRNTEHRSTSEDELNQSVKRMTFFDEPTSDKNHKEPRNTEHRSTSEDELNQSAKRMTFFDEPTSDKNHKEPRNTGHRSTIEDELNQSAKWTTFFNEPTSDKNHKEPRNIKYRLSEQFALLDLKAPFKRGRTNESAERKPRFEENEENVQEMRRVRERRKIFCKFLTILIIFSIIIVVVITTTVMFVAPKQSSGLEETSPSSKTTNFVEKESVSHLDSAGFNISSVTKTTLSYTEIEIESKEKTIKSSVYTGELQITASLISTMELTSFQSSTDTALSESIQEMSYETALDSSLIETPTPSISEFYFDTSLVSRTTLTSAFSDLETSTYSFNSAKQSVVGISTVFSGDIHPTTPTITNPQSPTSLLLGSDLQPSTRSIQHTASTDIKSLATAVSTTQWISSSQTVLETLTSTYSFNSAKQSAVGISTVFSGDIHPTTPTITNPQSPTSLLLGSDLQPSTRSIQHTASTDIKSSATAASTTQWISSSQTVLETLTVSETLTPLSSTADVSIPTSLLGTVALTGLQVLTHSSERFGPPSLPLITSTLATPQSLGLELSELLLSPTISKTDVQMSPSISATSALTNLQPVQAIPPSSLPFQSPSLLMNSLILSTPELFLSLTMSETDVQTTPFMSANSALTDLHELASSSERLEQTRLLSSPTIFMADAQISLTPSLFDLQSWTVSDLPGIQMGTSLSMLLQTSSPIHQTASSTNDI